MIQCVVIADDLTGACDAAGPFAAVGLRTVVRVADGADDMGVVVALSTDSRDVDAAESKRRLHALAPVVRALAPRVIFKKIDSTMRGNTGHEIIAAREAFGCEAAAVNPAFPAMRRIVVAGHLIVSGDREFKPFQVSTYLERHGAGECRHAPANAVDRVVRSGIAFLTMEGETDAELEEMADELLKVKREILWAGSAGLATALARRLGGELKGRPPAPAHGPVLFCIGSDHPATMKQVRALQKQDIALDPSGIAKGKHSLFRIPRDLDEDGIRGAICGCRPAALVLSGGDTASLVCRALRVRAIEITGEFSPGIPLGVVCGGDFKGVSVATKSGGFGAPNDLVHIAKYFHG